MITHEVNLAGGPQHGPTVTEDFHLDEADRAAMGRFGMEADELAAELRAGANLARPELQAAMLGCMQAGLIGAGMSQADAHDRAFDLLHNGAGSFERAREIVLKILESPPA